MFGWIRRFEKFEYKINNIIYKVYYDKKHKSIELTPLRFDDNHKIMTSDEKAKTKIFQFPRERDMGFETAKSNEDKIEIINKLISDSIKTGGRKSRRRKSRRRKPTRRRQR